MSHPSRPQARRPVSRRCRDLKIEAIYPLEDRCLLAPVLSLSPRLAAFTADATLPTGTNRGGVVITLGTADPTFLTSTPLDTVTPLTSIASFGGDIVRIKAGPGGVFGSGVYAISRGAGENAPAAATTTTTTSTTTPPIVNSAANRPGVIYRVDPATGKTSVFFDLNTVVPQLDKAATPGNTVGPSTGLVNWYDITFDPEGYFDGKPSMFVSSVDLQNPAKNAVYRIAADGTFMGIFLDFSSGASALKLAVNPSSILIPPVEDQTFLRGLLVGGGVSSTGGQFAALFFDANAFTPGQNLQTNVLPAGVTQTGMSLGPIVGMTAANSDYGSRVYSAFTDFGTPGNQGIPATNGNSGVQGLNGELLINNGIFPAGTGTLFVLDPNPDTTLADRYPIVPTDFRRFQDIAFDQYGYFSQGVNIGTTTTSTTTTGSVGGVLAGGGGGAGVGQSLGAGIAGTSFINNKNLLIRPGITLPPANAGNLFVADLSTGLSVSLTVPGATAGQPTTIRVPVQGPEFVTVTNTGGVISTSITPGPGLGGRIVRITPGGVVRNFAENFHTSNNIDASGFAMSSLSITFSADGTTMYAADDDGIWQFKTVASLAGSSSGSLIGLNDLRSLGVPYNGQGSAVAVIDSGVDGSNPYFRGRVAGGNNVFTNGFGNDDTSSAGLTTTATGGGGVGGGAGGTAATNPAPPTTADGHGTPVAGVIAQFVPQASIVPVNIFAPFLVASSSTTTGGGGGGFGGGGGVGGGAGITLSANTNALTNSQYLYQGLGYVASHPFVNDPVRPGQTNRIIAASLAFGSTNTFNSERIAYQKFPQVTIALKNQIKKFRSLGIAPIAAAGQFGAPLGAGLQSGGIGGGIGGGGGGGIGGIGNPGQANNNSENPAVGDVNGISLPAVLNEVVSVSGSYSYPFVTGPYELPTNPPVGIVPRPLVVPVLVFGNAIQLGGVATIGNTAGGGVGGGVTNTTTTTGFNALPTLLANADFAQYTDRILGSTNRSVTTDYVAPAIDVPTFRRTFAATTTTTGGGTTGGGTGTAAGVPGDAANHNTDAIAGTSMSAAIVTGAFALVSSALDYWANMNVTGVTSDAYLTQPVGVNTLNFGPHAFIDLTKYNNPDGINSILQWSAVPATDANDALSVSTPKNLIGGTGFRSYSRISVSNAIAVIEASVALNYLMAHDQLKYLDANSNGIISSTELQNFVDNANKTGMPEAGAMARLLGGTARPPIGPGINPLGQPTSETTFQESPNQPDVLQRRFNFLDYAADGTLNGSVTIAQLGVLAHTMLPTPDAFVINDRQRASVAPYLLAPTAQRNYHDLLHLKPSYMFIPKSALTKYHNISPAQFRVSRGLRPSASDFPVYTLFDGPTRTAKSGAVSNLAATAGTNAAATTTGTPAASSSNTSTGTPTASSSSTSTGNTNLGASQPVSTSSDGSTPTPVQIGAATPAGVLGVSAGNGAAAALNSLVNAIQNAGGANTTASGVATALGVNPSTSTNSTTVATAAPMNSTPTAGTTTSGALFTSTAGTKKF